MAESFPGMNLVYVFPVRSCDFSSSLPKGCNSNESHPTHWNTYDKFDAADLQLTAEEYTLTYTRA